jgi:hypothetical protein
VNGKSLELLVDDIRGESVGIGASEKKPDIGGRERGEGRTRGKRIARLLAFSTSAEKCFDFALNKVDVSEMGYRGAISEYEEVMLGSRARGSLRMREGRRRMRIR